MFYCETKFTEDKPPYTPSFTEFVRVPAEMTDWVTNEMTKPVRPKALVVWGPTRTGKTQWARSLGQHTYMSTLFNADDIDTECEYAIFDDIPIEFMKNSYKAWFGKCLHNILSLHLLLTTLSTIGAQETFTITDKYQKKRTITNWSKPFI